MLSFSMQPRKFKTLLAVAMISICTWVFWPASQPELKPPWWEESRERWRDHSDSSCAAPASRVGNVERERERGSVDWVSRLEFRSKKVFSQNGEDGILVYIFQNIGITDKFYVEFGCEDGAQRNTRYLQERCHWHGVLMDGGKENPSLNLTQEFITPQNIHLLFEKRGVPLEFDLLSIDVDTTDLWIWRSLALHHGYKPRVVVMEFNRNYAIDEFWTFPNDASLRWASSTLGINAPNDCLMGASLAALNLLSKEIGYTLIGTDPKSINAFFVRNDVLQQSGTTVPPLEVLHPPPEPLHRPCNKDRMDLRVDYKKWSESERVQSQL